MRVVIALLLALGLAAAATAQEGDAPDANFCNRSHADVADQIAGPWLLTQNVGVAIGGFVPVPLTAVETQRIAFRRGGGAVLILDAADRSQSMPMHPATGGLDLPQGIPGFVGPDGEPVDIQANANCAWEDMPRYAGELTYDLGQGKMVMQMVVHFPNTFFGFGLLRFSGTVQNHDFVAMRTVMFSRGTP